MLFQKQDLNSVVSFLKKLNGSVQIIITKYDQNLAQFLVSEINRSKLLVTFIF